MSFEIRWQSSPNFKSGRNNRKIVGICCHQTAGKFPGCLSWLCNPLAKASAHYIINRQGNIFQLVRDENTAYHAGIVNKPNWVLYDNSNPNYSLIGLEFECYPDVGGDGNLTEIQYQAGLWLINNLTEKHKLPVDRDHIIGHYQIDSINRAGCPGSAFPWDRLMKDLIRDKSLPGVNVIYENPRVELEGYLIKDKAFVELRKLSELMGKKVEWDNTSKTAFIK